MNFIVVYQCDPLGYYVGLATADESPLEPGVFLLPGGCVSEAPPELEEGKRQRYIDGGWILEDIPAPPEPTPAEILASQSLKLQGLTAECNAQKNALTNRISTLQDAIDLEMATPEEIAEKPARETQLKAWKTYGVLLGRVTTQAGWPPSVVWPTKPSAGMDLSVSASSPQTV